MALVRPFLAGIPILSAEANGLSVRILITACTYLLLPAFLFAPSQVVEAATANSVAVDDAGQIGQLGVTLIGIDGDGSLLLTGVSNSVSLGLKGSGVRGLKGSGVRGLKGSGVRGLKGSGVRSVTYENDNPTVVDYGIPLVALGPVSSIDYASGTIGILGQVVVVDSVTQTLDLEGNLDTANGLAGLTLLSAGDYIAVAGEVMDPGQHLGTVLIRMPTPYVDGATPVYVRTIVESVDQEIANISAGETSINFGAALYDSALFDVDQGSVVEFVGTTAADYTAVNATSGNIISSANGLKGSGVRGLKGSGVRGLKGSGVRGLKGSGVRGLKGSGVRGLKGSGVRGLKGSGVRGLKGSGVR